MLEVSENLDQIYDVENEEDSTLTAPNLMAGVVVTDTDWTAETVLSQVEKGNILLNPRFQRREAWEEKRKSRFIESLIIGLPIPQLVLAEMKGVRGKYVVIDGKQRLLSLAKFATFGTEAERFKLKGLEIRADLNGLNWDQIKQDNRFHADVAAFENALIRTTVIRGWNDEKALYLIFHRLNSGSVPLSPQELRHVLHPGKFIDFAFDFTETSPEMIRLMGSKGKPDFRMRDVELLIRFVGFYFFVSSYEGDLKEFLDGTVKRLNKSWDHDELAIRAAAAACTEAIAFTIRVFGEQDAFSKFTAKGAERRFNRAVFDVMAFYFCDPNVRRNIAEKNLEEAVKAAFSDLCLTSTKFARSLESTTKTKEAVATRLVLWGRVLQSVTDGSIPRLDELEAATHLYGLD